jgi:hypothetical protein
MSHKRRDTTRRRVNLAGIGVVTAGLMLWVLSEIATAPYARADDPITDIFTDIGGSINAGETELITAASDFASGDLPDGMAFGLAGADNLLFAPGEDVLVNGTDALLGDPEVGEFAFGAFPPPTDLADTLTEVQSVLQSGATDFGTAANALLSDDLATSVLFGTESAESVLFAAPEVAFVGLADTLLGI